MIHPIQALVGWIDIADVLRGLIARKRFCFYLPC